MRHVVVPVGVTGSTDKESWPEIAELMAPYLAYGQYVGMKPFTSRLVNCLPIYRQSVIRTPFELIPDLILFRSTALLELRDDQDVHLTQDAPMSDQARISLRYIPSIHDLLGITSGA
jgi:hypothetical protein